MKFKVDDKVAVLDDDLEGFVSQIVNNEIVIRTTEGFLLVFDESELVKVEEPLSHLNSIDGENLNKILKEKEQASKSKRPTTKKREKKAPPMEVDLHIHKLVPSTKGMSNYDMLSLQLETAERQLKFAVEKRIQRIVFIHGVGEGVLKTELEYLLSRYENINYYDADYQKYGMGATEVYILQNY